MRLFKMEFYKITARPVMNLALLAMIGFFLFILYQEASGTRTEIDGTVYQGLEAVRQDRRLAKEYEGPFTMEKAEAIAERFGFSGYIGRENMEYAVVREGNFCSQFVTDKLTDFLQTEQRPSGFSSGDTWENYGKYFVSGEFQFGYTRGWEKLQDIWHLAVTSLNIWLILMAAPVFSEEYSRNTTEILLTTNQGKSRDIRRKIEAAMGLGCMVCVLMMVLLFVMTGVLYGWDGLEASAGIALPWADYGSIGNFLGLLFLSGLVSVLLNVGITLFLSSKCRRPVSAVTAGVILFVLPFGVDRVLFPMLLGMGTANYYWGWVFMDLMRVSCYSMPVYLPHPGIYTVPPQWLRYIPVIATMTLGITVWRGHQNYRHSGMGRRYYSGG